MRLAFVSSLILMAAACSPSEPATPNEDPGAAAAASPAAPIGQANAAASDETDDGGVRDTDYLGRWTASDGRSLVVVDLPRGGMALEFTDAERSTVALPGSVTAEGLRFMRDDIAESAVIEEGPDGRPCLNLRPTEVYCR